MAERRKLIDNRESKCCFCDKPLKRFPGKSRFWATPMQCVGWQGNNFFCSQRCAAEWAILKASAGVK